MSTRIGAGSVSRRLSERARAAAKIGTDTAVVNADLFGRLREMVEHITQAVGAASQQAAGNQDQTAAGSAHNGRVVFGYNVSMGLDGLRMEPFGDVQRPDGAEADTPSDMPRGKRAAAPAAATRAPIVDIFDEGNTIRVVAELPGVSDADITCRLTGLDLHIATAGQHRYAKTVRLPWLADMASLTQTCRNGILEVCLTRAATP